MPYFSYRNKMRLKSLLIGLLIALLVLAAVIVGIFLYLQRYIVYTADGAHLDFGIKPTAVDTAPSFDVESPDSVPDDLIIGAPVSEPTPELPEQLNGYYITGAMLADPDALLAALDTLESPLALMIEVKSIFGNYYYSSALNGAETSSLVYAPDVDALIATLAARNDIYLIAKVPAFRDSAFALSNQSYGLPLSNGALWMDSQSCYWLDPAKDGVISHLESIALELQSLGFDEVAYDDFYFPESANISYSDDSAAALQNAAKRLSANLASEEIKFSIYTTDASLAVFTTHAFVLGEDGAAVQDIAHTMESVSDSAADFLVFQTDSRDTRFTSYGLLRPLLEADADN